MSSLSLTVPMGHPCMPLLQTEPAPFQGKNWVISMLSESSKIRLEQY